MIRAFSLIELLVVTAIIAIVAALLFPVLASAKRASKDTVTLSNLRQCGMALLMYADDNGGFESLPTDASAVDILRGAPTWDPQDTWRPNGTSPAISPMIGSYAYVRFVNTYQRQDWWQLLLNGDRHPTLLLSIFSANNVAHPFDQNVRYEQVTNFMPDRTVRFMADGSATTTMLGPDWTRHPLQWDLLFTLWQLYGRQ